MVALCAIVKFVALRAAVTCAIYDSVGARYLLT